MVGTAPAFWWRPPDWRAWALWPVAAAYGAVARHLLLQARREKVGAPVLCVGNFTVGGAGKTPVAIALAAAARRAGMTPGILSRGHGGMLGEARLVDVGRDSATTVGDEPLLLAAHANVAVTPDRAAGARLLIGSGCDFLIMDDGFQSARIHMDLAVLLVDARRGLGNGHLLPGGPLRAPVIDQLSRADAVLKMGEGAAADVVMHSAAHAGKPVFHARARPRPAAGIAGGKFLAFAGIGDPKKFFDSVAEAGGTVVERRAFPDHHLYRDEELDGLQSMARRAGLALITTAKDAARLRHGSAAARAMLENAEILEIETLFEPADLPDRLIAQTLQAFEARRGD
jgi:tetraacyldisaccharide 4'-kinase